MIYKGTKEKIEKNVNKIIYELKDIVKLSNNNFKEDVCNNFNKICDYLEFEFKGDLPYKTDQLINYYKGESNPCNIPPYKLVMVRYTGDEAKKVHPYHIDNIYPYSSVYFLNKNAKLIDFKLLAKTEKYLGYSDGNLFHFLGGEKIYSKGSKFYEFLSNILKENRIPYIKESVTKYCNSFYNKKEIKEKYYIFCNEIYTLPVNKLNSWVLKWNESAAEYKPYFTYMNTYINKEEKDVNS